MKVTLDLADGEEFVANVLDETFFASPLDIGDACRGALVGVRHQAARRRPDRRGGRTGGDGDGDGRVMETSNKTARELYEIVKADRGRRRFGFGRKPALVNVDLQNAYTRPDEFPTAYETEPRQIEHVNALAGLFAPRPAP